ncbi:dienelactone hydrolase family protein [Nonomuraea sp. NPDC003804]|uniref:dienelactone hydrolase family protein n=1 Tax=Nonomuraea sp. NPDC003804 TaxID=3154547 RepID=UPI0033B5E106
MCYDAAALPPVPGPAVTQVAEAGPLTLTATDGALVGAYLARPERPSGAAVLVLPDNKGLSVFYETLTIRLAEQGHTALAIDYFARTAGIDYRSRGAEFDDMAVLMPHLVRLTPASLDADINAAAEHVRSIEARSLFSLGFCFGGRQAFRSAAARFGLAGAVGFYGFPDAINGAPGPTQLAADLTAPILALWGGADEAIPPATVDAFAEALTTAGCPHEFVTYPGAPHGFFELAARDFADAAADAWRRTLDFVGTHAGLTSET